MLGSNKSNRERRCSFGKTYAQWLFFAFCAVLLFVIMRFSYVPNDKVMCESPTLENVIEEQDRRLQSEAITSNSFFGCRFGSKIGKIDAAVDEITSFGRGYNAIARKRVVGMPPGLDEIELHYTAESMRLYRITAKKMATGKPLCKDIMIADAEFVVSIFTNAFPDSVSYEERFDPGISTHNLYASGRVGDLQFSICIYCYETSQWIDFDLVDERLMAVARRESEQTVKRDKDSVHVASTGEIAVSIFGSLIFLYLPLAVGVAAAFCLVCLVQFVFCSATKRNFDFYFSWPDVLMVVLPAIIWGCLEQVGNGKSLSNVIELPILGMGIALSYGFRVFAIYLVPNVRPFVWSCIGVLVMAVLAALMALYFPFLPE